MAGRIAAIPATRADATARTSSSTTRFTRGECGGKDAAAAYRRFVTEGLTGRVENPLKSALGEWVIGSEDFLKQMVALASPGDWVSRGRVARRTKAFSIAEILAQVAEAHGVEALECQRFRSRTPGREMAALLCRRYTQSTLSELSEAFGLGHPDSSANLVRRAKREEEKSSSYRKKLREIEAHLFPKTEDQVRPGEAFPGVHASSFL